MTMHRFVTGILFSVFGLGVLTSASAQTTADPTQVLDRVEVFNTNEVLRMKFDTTPTGYTMLNTTRKAGQTGYRACQFSPAAGLFCLDGSFVRNWPSPQTDPPPVGQLPVETVYDLFSCADRALALDRKPDACTSMTVDLKGDIWLAGRKSNNLHNLIRITKKDSGSNCVEGNPLTGVGTASIDNATQFSKYCYKVYRTGRPLLLDISPVDGELAAKFNGKGILGVEERKTVVFFPNDLNQPVVVLGSGKSDWNLIGNEQVQSAALYQVTDEGDPAIVGDEIFDNFGLITTNTGRVMWRNVTTLNQPAQLLLNLPSLQSGSACTTTGTQFFDIRASNVTGQVFAGDRNFCQISAFKPAYSSADGTLTGTSTPLSVSTGTQTVDGISVSPGISIDLTECKTGTNTDGTGGCTLIEDTSSETANTYKAARMYSVSLGSTATGMVLFQIKNIPDCRYFPAPGDPAYASTLGTEHPCNRAGLVTGGAAPQQQWLNVAPLLPQDIKDLFDQSGKKPTGLPPMWMSPRYRAQAGENYYFEALFGITEPTVQFRKRFTVELDIGDPNLIGDKLGCGVAQTPTALPFNQWDIITTVSERFTNVGGPRNIVVDTADTSQADDVYEGEHADMLLNSGCFNPTSGSGTRWSMYSYGLELAEDVQTGSTWSYSSAKVYLGNMLKSLHANLFDMQTRLACANADAVANTGMLPANQPVSPGTCTGLANSLTSTTDKLNKCVLATYDPKTSAIDQNCNAFETQFSNYLTTVNSLSPFGTDPANRVGELAARADVIWYIYQKHFLPAFSLCAANATGCTAQ